jgi:hypothetical protein
MSKFACCSDVPYDHVVRFMEKMSQVPYTKKEAHVRLFLDKCVPRPCPDIFQTFRLLLPLVSGACGVVCRALRCAVGCTARCCCCGSVCLCTPAATPQPTTAARSHPFLHTARMPGGRTT